MKRKTQVLYREEDLLVNLTFHKVPASLLAEFAEKIVKTLWELRKLSPRSQKGYAYKINISFWRWS